MSLSKTETRSRYKSFVLLISSLPTQQQKENKNESYQVFSCPHVVKMAFLSFRNRKKYVKKKKNTVKLTCKLTWQLKLNVCSETLPEDSPYKLM